MATQTTTKRAGEYLYAVGKRKTSIARVRLYIGGKGDIVVNEMPIEKYFTLITGKGIVSSPLKLTGMNNKYKVNSLNW